jgi:transformation/transcription domain-associated protein
VKVEISIYSKMSTDDVANTRQTAGSAAPPPPPLPQQPAIHPQPIMTSGSMNWEPMRQRLVGSSDLQVSLEAAQELLAVLETVPASEFPLMLSALLPSFSSVLASKTRPVADTASTEHQVRQAVLEWMSKLPGTEVLRPHAPHLVAVAMDVLTRDYEENAVTASRILFDLYKTYRTLPTDYVQPYLDFVTAHYRGLPVSVQRNFHKPVLVGVVPTTPATVDVGTVASPVVEVQATKDPAKSDEEAKDPDAMEIDQVEVLPESAPMNDESNNIEAPSEAPKSESAENTEGTSTLPAASDNPQMTTPAAAKSSSATTPLSSSMSVTSAASSQQPTPRTLLKSNASFRVLTECPLVVMLMFQLYPQFMKTNIPVLIKVMMAAIPPIGRGRRHTDWN